MAFDNREANQRSQTDSGRSGPSKRSSLLLRILGVGIICRHLTSFMANPCTTQLCPAQKGTFDHLSAGLQVGSIVRLWDGVGRGKTTILKKLHKQVGGLHI